MRCSRIALPRGRRVLPVPGTVRIRFPDSPGGRAPGWLARQSVLWAVAPGAPSRLMAKARVGDTGTAVRKRTNMNSMNFGLSARLFHRLEVGADKARRDPAKGHPASTSGRDV